MDRTKKKQNAASIVIKIVVAVFLVVLMLLGGYVAYFSAAFYRLGDMAVSVNENTSDEKLYSYKTYNLLSWNIGFAAYSHDYSFFMDGGKYSRAFSEDAVKENLDGIKSMVKSAASFYGSNDKFDILCFQEVDVDGDRSYHINENESLMREYSTYWSTFVQNYDSPYIAFPIFNPHGKNTSGLSTFSAFPIVSAERKELTIESGYTKYFDLDRCLSISRMKVLNGKELVVINLHLTAFSSDGSVSDKQIEEILSICKDEIAVGNYVICAGDFNKDVLGNSPEVFGVDGDKYNWAKPFKTELLKDSGMKLIAPEGSGDYDVPTCRNPDSPYHKGQFVVTVDGFMVSSNIEVVSSAVYNGKFMFSDHNPVCLSFKLK